jgi:hypothetical protein
MDFNDKDIAALVKGIFDGEITEYDLPENLYTAIADYLRTGLYKGFGSSIGNVPEGNAELLGELRENIYMFSAAKTFQQVKEMAEKLMNDDGKVTPFNEFKKEANEIFKTYNKDYLKSEYATAIGQGQIAVKWNSIQRQKDILPYLEYSTIGDACVICAPLDHFTALVDDPAWDSIMPLNHFNCMCIVEQLDKEEGAGKETQDPEEFIKPVVGRMSDVFKMNAGKDKVVFNKDHPYFTVPKDDKGFAQDNFDLKLPKNDD